MEEDEIQAQEMTRRGKTAGRDLLRGRGGGREGGGGRQESEGKDQEERERQGGANI